MVLLFWNQLLDLETGCERCLLLDKHIYIIIYITVLSPGLKRHSTQVQWLLPARFARKPRVRTSSSPNPKHRRRWQHTGSSGGVSGWGTEPWIPGDLVQKDSGFSVESGDSGLALPSLLITHNLSPQFQNPVQWREERHVSKG